MTRNLLQGAAFSWFSVFLLGVSAIAQTLPKPPRDVSHELMRQALADHPGTDVIMLAADCPPGGATPSHDHPGYTYAYVLEGSVISQLEDQHARTYTTGKMRLGIAASAPRGVQERE